MKRKRKRRGSVFFSNWSHGHQDGCRIIAPTAVRVKQLRHEERHLVVVTSFLPRNKFPLPERRKVAEQEDVLHHFLFLTL